MPRGQGSNLFLTSPRASHPAERAAQRLALAARGNLKRSLGGRSLILDMDDTLISNQVLFDRAAEALVETYMSFNSDNLEKAEIETIHEEIDHNLIASLGYTPKRWRTSAQLAGRQVAGRELTQEEKTKVAQAAEIAMGVGELLPGTKDTLSILRDSGVTMVLKTKGCPDKQAEKLRAHNMSQFFGERIVVVDIKNSDSFRDIVARFNLSRPVSIGDSEKSDIVPALEAGLEAIHIKPGGKGFSFEKMGGVNAPKSDSMPEALISLLSR